jgi:hypothetical protein
MDIEGERIQMVQIELGKLGFHMRWKMQPDAPPAVSIQNAEARLGIT